LLPALCSVALAIYISAAHNYEFNLILALIAVLGVCFGHLSANLFDDYFDYKAEKTNYREKLVHKGMRARIKKCDYLINNTNTISQLLAACFIFSAAAVLIGTII